MLGNSTLANTAMPSGVVADKGPGVPQELDRIASSFENLSALVHALADRISPVLAPNRPQNEGEKVPHGNHPVPLLNALIGHRSKQDELARFVSSVIDRIEL